MKKSTLNKKHKKWIRVRLVLGPRHDKIIKIPDMSSRAGSSDSQMHKIGLKNIQRCFYCNTMKFTIFSHNAFFPHAQDLESDFR